MTGTGTIVRIWAKSTENSTSWVFHEGTAIFKASYNKQKRYYLIYSKKIKKNMRK